LRELAMVANVPTPDDPDEKLRKGQAIELLVDLPPKSKLVKAGTKGTVEASKRGRILTKKYQLKFLLGGANSPVVVLEDVLREQFRKASPR
jgi:hypothetical protein